jgi:ATP synthase protein I
VNHKPERRRPRYAPMQMGRTAEAAWEASLSVVTGAGIGFLLDRWAGTAPWLMVVFVVIGTLAAFRRLLALAKAESREPRNGGPPGNGSSTK